MVPLVQSGAMNVFPLLLRTTSDDRNEIFCASEREFPEFPEFRSGITNLGNTVLVGFLTGIQDYLDAYNLAHPFKYLIAFLCCWCCNKLTSFFLIYFNWMFLAMIVYSVDFAWLPNQVKLFLSFSTFEPIESKVIVLGAFW